MALAGGTQQFINQKPRPNFDPPSRAAPGGAKEQTEFELVPAPFAHYIEDDPEAFKGPSDEWYIVDVFFDEIAAGLRRIEEDPNADQLVVCLRLVSIAPLRAGKG